MTRLHQFFLNRILNFFDMDEGLLGAVSALGDSLGDAHGGCRITLEREEGFADGDFDFLFAPGNDLIVATNHAQGIHRR